MYDEQGDLIARAGEHVDVRDRLALDGKKLAVISINKSLNPFRARMAHSTVTSDTRHPHPANRSQTGG